MLTNHDRALNHKIKQILIRMLTKEYPQSATTLFASALLSQDMLLQMKPVMAEKNSPSSWI